MNKWTVLFFSFKAFHFSNLLWTLAVLLTPHGHFQAIASAHKGITSKKKRKRNSCRSPESWAKLLTQCYVCALHSCYTQCYVCVLLNSSTTLWVLLPCWLQGVQGGGLCIKCYSVLFEKVRWVFATVLHDGHFQGHLAGEQKSCDLFAPKLDLSVAFRCRTDRRVLFKAQARRVQEGTRSTQEGCGRERAPGQKSGEEEQGKLTGWWGRRRESPRLDRAGGADGLATWSHLPIWENRKPATDTGAAWTTWSRNPYVGGSSE